MARYFMSKGVKMPIFGKLTCHLKMLRLQFESKILLITFCSKTPLVTTATNAEWHASQKRQDTPSSYRLFKEYQ